MSIGLHDHYMFVPNSKNKILCPSCGCWDTVKEIESSDYMLGLGYKKYRCVNKRFKGLPCIQWYRKVIDHN